MTIKDEILEELRKGALRAEINRRFRSQSQKYEAMREFLGEAKEIVEKMHEELSFGQTCLELGLRLRKPPTRKKRFPVKFRN